MPRDLVALAAFPKSGVTYLSSLLFYSLFPETADSSRIDISYVVDIHAYRSALDSGVPINGQRFFKTHFSFGADAALDARTAKVINLIRDPIDVANSAYDFQRLVAPNDSVTHSEFINRWIETGGGHFQFAGTWKDHVASWTAQNDVPLLLVNYADLVDKPLEQLARMFDFLGVAPSSDAVDRAIIRSSMKVMREREESEFASKTEGAFYRPDLDEAMSKGARFINKGYRNSYNSLDAAQKAAADLRFGKNRFSSTMSAQS